MAIKYTSFRISKRYDEEDTIQRCKKTIDL